MEIINKMTLIFSSLSINESFARATVAAFVASLNPTIDEITDIKTAVSEAVTNCIVHAYPNTVGSITIDVKLTDSDVYITVADTGVGIVDFDKVKQPFYTTKIGDERSGMGFTVMESFMDKVDVAKNKSKGVMVKMQKKLGRVNKILAEG
ncbi:MAG: anti-sigma F factor [Clostridia bacterium]|nr:anti-sigma F factor [Clostridia bacterium]